MSLHFVFFIQRVYSDKITYQSILEWNSVSHFRPVWWWSSPVNMLGKEQNSRTHLQIVILENWPWNSSLCISTSKNSLIFQLSSCWPYATCTQLRTEVARETRSWQLSVLHSSERKEQLRTICTAPLVPLHSQSYLSNNIDNQKMQGWAKAKPEHMVFCSTWSHFCTFSHAEVSR